MSYIDAGYAIALTVLAGYAGQLWQRRRRLERLAARRRVVATSETPQPPAPVVGNDAPSRTETRVGA